MKLNWKTTPPDKPGDYAECWRTQSANYYSMAHIFEAPHTEKLKAIVSSPWIKTISLSTYVKKFTCFWIVVG